MATTMQKKAAGLVLTYASATKQLERLRAVLAEVRSQDLKPARAAAIAQSLADAFPTFMGTADTHGVFVTPRFGDTPEGRRFAKIAASNIQGISRVLVRELSSRCTERSNAGKILAKLRAAYPERAKKLSAELQQEDLPF